MYTVKVYETEHMTALLKGGSLILTRPDNTPHTLALFTEIAEALNLKDHFEEVRFQEARDFVLTKNEELYRRLMEGVYDPNRSEQRMWGEGETSQPSQRGS